ncbi:gliding motility-associated C-terminal domain-containing protein [Pyxidicoccus sp. MSG2]|uniref:T9SS type B sorting domain-containing protein n=1 Tax=Pyxidicoccus sp. MSG2 TaxID=2996790 RepID=UPI0022722B3F|nr:gliding motility-associated C-terminal domain-containing protein [Pyxidicoccus sp. MSG2]MCY1022694.1 gliding motility-associated C-terminal domain-containing protein [Pyxidicoccus sp. MSG2]
MVRSTLLLLLLFNVNAHAQALIHPYGSFCVGQMNVFSFTGPGTVTSWSVSSGATLLSGGTPGASHIQLKWDSPAFGAYVNAYYNNNGYSGGVTYSNINIAASVTPSVSITANQTNICPGASVTFTASPVNGGSSPYYSWYVNGSYVTGGANMNTYTASSLTNGQQVTCVMSSNAPCLTSTSATSNAITINVIDTSQPLAATISGNTTICQSTAPSFSAAVSNATGPITYQWKKNGVNVSSYVAGPPAYVLVLAPGSISTGDVITCSVSSACSASATSNSLTTTVTQPQAFTVSVAPSQINMAPGSTVVFTANSNLPATNYQWSMNGSPVPGATGSTFTTTATSRAALRSVAVSATTTATCVSNTTASGNASIIPFMVSSVTGNKSVAPGGVETYTVNWDWNSTFEASAVVNWSVINGTILSSNKHTATVQWNSPSMFQDAVGYLSVTEDYEGQNAGTSVNIVNRTTQAPEFCDGFQGPPAIFVDFGAGGNPGAPLPAGTSSYTYLNHCALNPGEYTVVNSTANCRSNWLGTQDHTPNDVNGYMLMVDADDRRGEFYRTTVNGLNNAFRYEFSAWVGNLTSIGDDPGLRFEVHDLQGKLLGASADITVPYSSPLQWHKIGFMFDLPNGTTSAQVVIVNRHNNNNGNDMVIDDISFAPCYTPIIASFSPNPTIQHKAQVCANGGTKNLYSWWPTSSIPFSDPRFKWQKSVNGGPWTDIAGATAMNALQTETAPSVYQYRVIAYSQSNPSQMLTSNAITYYVSQLVVEAKTYDVFACESTPQTLNSNVYIKYPDPGGPVLNYTYNWSPATYLNNTQIANPVISLPSLAPPPLTAPAPPPVLYTYTLAAQNTNFGCSGSATQTVAHYNPRRVAVPNAFTPNGDGLNDVFRPVNIWDYPGSEFWVYNRWGQVVFYSQGPNYDWNGTYQSIPQGSGVFVWRVEMAMCSGNLLNSETGDSTPHGNVTLIR